MSVNVRKLAELTGVSVATISRVLKGDPVVENTTRERVLQALAQHPFYPDLKQKKKRIRNLFLFLSPVNISDRLHLLQVELLLPRPCRSEIPFRWLYADGGTERYLMLSPYRKDRLSETLRELEQASFAGSIAGVFILHTSITDDAALAHYRGGLKLYLLNRTREDIPNESIDFIFFDDRLVSRLAFDHLAVRGHRNVLVFSGPDDYRFFEKREHAFREHAGDPDCRFVFRNTESNSAEAAFDHSEELLGSGEREFSAVFVTSEVLLEGFLRSCDMRGIRIPEDLSILSTNDYLVAYQHTPPISVVRTPSFELGKVAAAVATENMAFEFATRVDYCLSVILNDRGSVADLAAAASAGGETHHARHP